MRKLPTVSNAAVPAPVPVFAAIDTTEVQTARDLCAKLAGKVGGIKLGLEFFVSNGPQGVRDVMDGQSAPLFLDLKLHDIPNTVAGGVRAALPLKPAFITIHASGGPAMIEAAARAAEAAGPDRPKILAVTVLTSLDDTDLVAVGQMPPAAQQVERLARLAHDHGADGLVCSPAEVAVLRAIGGPGMLLVVPGIRPVWSATGDQKRSMTPAQAMKAGASYLVIGRPISEAADPAEAARKIAAELAQG